MSCFNTCCEYLSRPRSNSSTVTPHAVPRIILTGTPKKAHDAAAIIQSYRNSVTCYIAPMITPAHISSIISFESVMYLPHNHDLEQNKYSRYSVPIDHLIDKVKAALERYIDSGLNGGVFTVAGTRNSSANTVQKIFQDVLNAKSLWNLGINEIRNDVLDHKHRSTIHKDFIVFVDTILCPLVQEALNPKVSLPPLTIETSSASQDPQRTYMIDHSEDYREPPQRGSIYLLEHY